MILSVVKTRGRIRALAVVLPVFTCITASSAAQAINRPDAGHPLPATPSNASALFGVSVVSAASTWAAGTEGRAAIVQHWNGSSWSVVSSVKAPQSVLTSFAAISARSNRDVWAVGGSRDRFNHQQDLAQHWDGRRWSVVPTPSPSRGSGSSLTGVVSLAPDDAWAVGINYNTAAMTGKPFALHWNGMAWSLSWMPGASNASAITGVSAASGNDVWAVGVETSKMGRVSRTLAEHWDGNEWQRSATPNPDRHVSSLFGVTLLPSGEAWAVGNTAINGKHRPLIEHYVHGKWSASSLSKSENYESLGGVGARSKTDLWAVGTGAGHQRNRAVALHWDGRTWKHVKCPNPPGLVVLWSVFNGGDRATWAVGQAISGSRSHAVSLLWDGRHWTLH